MAQQNADIAAVVAERFERGTPRRRGHLFILPDHRSGNRQSHTARRARPTAQLRVRLSNTDDNEDRGASTLLYSLCKYVLIGPVLRLFFPAKVIGAEYVPADGGVILVGNHLSVADSFFTPLLIKRRVTYLAKS